MVGYRTRFAIECKNERVPIGSPPIDAFVGKLQYLGIPCCQGIYLSASGYTSGAVERAAAAGIRPLVLTGITKAGLAETIGQALQSVVHLLLDVRSLQIRNNVASAVIPHEVLIFRNQHGRICGTVLDLVWLSWLSNAPPSTIGVQEITLSIPSHWQQVVDGQAQSTVSATATVAVVGLIITLAGEIHGHTLVNAANHAVERSLSNAAFDMTGSRLLETIVHTEADLSAALEQSAAIRVTLGRIRLPRIRYGSLYWPLSERVAREADALVQRVEQQEATELLPTVVKGLESSALAAAWEAIWKEHLAAILKSVEAGTSDHK